MNRNLMAPQKVHMELFLSRSASNSTYFQIVSYPIFLLIFIYNNVYFQI